MSFRLLVGVACAVAGVPAQALVYSTTYTSTTGVAMNASFSFQTSGALNAKGGYDIQTLSGNINGDAITGLVANPSQPDRSVLPGGFSYDNIFFDKPGKLDTDGVLFSTASGLTYNFWEQGSTLYDLEVAVENSSGVWSGGARSSGYIGSPSPPPATKPTGAATVLTFEDATPYLIEGVSTQGFIFSNAGNCCDYVQTEKPTDANGWQYLHYRRTAETMRTTDNRLFSISDLDIGAGNGAVVGNVYPVTLTGTFADRSTITTTLDLTYGFKNYTLSGFDNLRSLTFSHPVGPDSGVFIALDNIAVRATTVPEPASWAMMVGGFALLGGAMRTRRRAVFG